MPAAHFLSLRVQTASPFALSPGIVFASTRSLAISQHASPLRFPPSWKARTPPPQKSNAHTFSWKESKM